MSEPSSTPSGEPSETIAPAGDGQRGFEDAAERLESIVREMENGRLPLEELILRYEEGMKLVEFCNSSLARAEKRIEVIQRTAEGTLTVESLDETDDAAGDISEEENASPASARKSRQPAISPQETSSAESASDKSDEEDDELSLF